MTSGPVIGVIMGDPCGIGPEVLAKAVMSGVDAASPARIFAIGSAAAMGQAVRVLGSRLEVRSVARAEDLRFGPGQLDVLDPGTLDPAEIVSGQLSAACGRAVVEWRGLAASLACEGHADALVQGPINMEAIRLGTGLAVPPPLGSGDAVHLLLVAGALRVIHLSDHITLSEAIQRVRLPAVLALVRLTHAALVRWGLPAPRIAVAGLNPHCKGTEDEREIAPAVARAREEGIDAVGPLPPDTVFHAAAGGAFDCVVSQYHDQGHIAIKTSGFSGSCAIVLGEPALRVSVAHGTAFDIAGRGQADPCGMQAALTMAASLAAGRGFPAVGEDEVIQGARQA
jgi:4-hydroxy-L-threonine phosphate dehydrogenase PdxA